MLKVFLVEDEFVVRQGIKNKIAWEQHGYDFCGEASDGELALPLIRKHKPDILITDIKMPFMDGLELSRIVRKEFPDMEIMILSGYEEFAYAKEAIRLGISSYLLKPISSDALLQEVGQVAERILREKKAQDKFRQGSEEMARQERQHLFRDLVSGTCPVSELLELGERHHLELGAACYKIVLFKFSEDQTHPLEYSNSLIHAMEEQAKYSNPRALLFDRELEGVGALLKADMEDEIKEVQAELIAFIQRVAEKYNLQYAVGVGGSVNRLSELKNSFTQASRAFAHRFFTSGSCIIDEVSTNEDVEDVHRGEPSSNVRSVEEYRGECSSNVRSSERYHGDRPSNGDVASVYPGDMQELNLADVNPKKINRSRILDFLRTGDRAETRYFMEDLFENSGSSAMESFLFRQYLVMGMYLAVVEFVEELGASRDELEPLDLNRCLSMGLEFSREYLQHLLEQALTIREKAVCNRYGEVVDAAVRFIEENYANPDLSLNMAASHVKFSPNYLSKIFSEQTGETFIRFLTDYRMNKAKELLRCTNRKSSEIAYEVGYKDPHYFSFLFKKQTGVSPKQYRGEN